MQDTLKIIDLIMKPYYDKLKENEELFNMPSREKVRIESELKRLKEERIIQSNNLKMQLEQLRNNKESEINEYISEYFLPEDVYQNDKFDKLEKLKERQIYENKIDELTHRLYEISEKEKEIKEVTKQLRELRANRGNEKKEFVSSKVVGNDPNTGKVVSANFDHIYRQNESSLISKLIELTGEVEERESLESELRNLKSYVHKELISTESMKRVPIDKLEEEYSKREQSLVSSIEKLSKESDEEIELKQELELLPKRPNYDRVYKKELTELKIELGISLSNERIRLKTILAIKEEEKNKIMDIYHEREQFQNGLIEEQQKKLDEIRAQLTDLKTVYDENGRAINEAERSVLVNRNNAIAMEIKRIKSQSLLDKDKQSELDLLNSEINTLLRTLSEIEKNSKIVALTKEDGDMLVAELTSEELAEYDRRKSAKSIEQNRNLANFDLERQSINYSNTTVNSNRTEMPPRLEESRVDLGKSEEAIIAPTSAPSISVDSVSDIDDATLDIDESLENSEETVINEELPEAIIENKEQNEQNYQDTSEVETIGETVQQPNKEPFFEVNINYDDVDSNDSVNPDTNSNSDDYYNPSDVPSDLVPVEDLTYNDAAIDGNKIIVDDMKNLVQIMYQDIISNIDSIDTVRLNPSETDNSKLYFSSKDDESKYYFEGAISPSRVKDRIEYLYGEYVSEDDIMDAFNKYPEVSKGRTYEVTETNKLFSVSESKIREIYREFKKCSIIRLEKTEDQGMKVSTKEATSRDLIPSGNVETSLNEGDYIRKVDLMAALQKTLKLELFKTLSSKMRSTVQSNVSDDFDDVEIDMSDELPNGKHR